MRNPMAQGVLARLISQGSRQGSIGRDSRKSSEPPQNSSGVVVAPTTQGSTTIRTEVATPRAEIAMPKQKSYVNQQGQLYNRFKNLNKFMSRKG